MKTVEIFDRFIREGWDNGQCGICHGSDVNHVNASNYFGMLDDSLVLRNDWDYLYYYGERDFSASFMPKPDIFAGLCDGGSHLFLWVLE